jgi:DNA repair exonuclease SbcCD ATPase subunit
MSSDLVKRLRVKMKVFRICQESADRIEALEGEVADLNKRYENTHQRWDKALRRAEAAEARAERLRVAITEAVTCCDVCGGSGLVAISTWDHTAEPQPEACVECYGLRKALEDDKQ